jgi:hypothetical protein
MSKIFNKYFPWLLFVTISSILACIWFKEGKLLAAAEEGLFLYDPIRSLKLFSSLWMEIGTGYSLPIYLPRVTLLLFITGLHNLGLQVWITQAFIYFIAIFSAMSGVYLLGINLFGSKYKNPVIFASLFYVFNLYTQTQIIGRLLTTDVIGWVYFPFFLLFFILWIEKANFNYLIIFGISSVIFSVTYGMPTFVITFWSTAFIWLLVYLFKNKNKFQIVILRFFIILFVFVLFNLWWLYPVIKLASSSFSVVSNQANFDSLRGVSQFFPTEQIIFLKQSSYFTKDMFYGYYNNILVFILSVSAFIVMLYGIVLSRKKQVFMFLFLLLILGWFFCKGSNPPFGFTFFYWLFKVFPSMQLFRNPYEKSGIIFLLPYAYFIGQGIYGVSGFLKQQFRIYSYSIFFIAYFILIPLPIWRGDVFGVGVQNVFVQVPDYYKTASILINKDQGDGRILMLPMLDGDSVRYMWKDGSFQGVDPSEFLFNRESVSRILRSFYPDAAYMKLYKSFTQQQDIISSLDQLNIAYLIIHNDLDYKFSGASSPASVKKTLSEYKSIKYLKTTGQLDIYRYMHLKENSLFEINNRFKLNYKKISSSYYQLFVQNVSEPYSLIFKESYDPLWTASIQGQNITNHSVVYGYANKWNIDKKGSYYININYRIWPW